MNHVRDSDSNYPTTYNGVVGGSIPPLTPMAMWCRGNTVPSNDRIMPVVRTAKLVSKVQTGGSSPSHCPGPETAEMASAAGHVCDRYSNHVFGSIPTGPM